jgi:hypothetical protein
VSKYRNVRTEVDGITFASRREANRYGELKLLERAREIQGLTLQPAYDLVIDGTKICRYVGDFRYIERDHVIVEDSKGCKTREYKIKKKLMKAIFGIEIRET